MVNAPRSQQLPRPPLHEKKNPVQSRRNFYSQNPRNGEAPPLPPRQSKLKSPKQSPRYSPRQETEAQYQEPQHHYSHHHQQQQQYYQPQIDLESSLPPQGRHPRAQVYGRRASEIGSTILSPRNRKSGRLPNSHRQPTAGHKTGTVQKPTGQSSDAPTWMREVNQDVVPRSKEIKKHRGWKTQFRNEFEGAFGAPSGAALDDSAQSSDAPAWMQKQSKYSPRGTVPVYKQTGRNSNDLGVQAYRNISSRAFDGAAGAPTGAALDDSAHSGDAPVWMQQQSTYSPRGTVPVYKQVGRASNDLGVQAYRNISSRAFEGAAGHSSGAVLDDSAESGDAPLWMRKMGSKEGVQRSRYNVGSGWKTTFDDKLFSGAAGRRNGVPLSDDAQSIDAPEWMIKQTSKSLRKKEIKHDCGWKTDFTKEFEGRLGKPSGAVLDDSAESGDAPDWMKEQSYLSPRGTVHDMNRPGRGSNDLGIQGYRAVDSELVSKGAAGRHTGILADDSAVSSDLPEFMMIPEIPVHPGNKRHGKQATWKTEMENHHSDTAVSASAPAFFHIDGVGQYGEKYKDDRGSNGIAVGSNAKHFHNAAGKTTGGQTDDSSISAEMPDYLRNNKYVHVRNSTQRGMGLGHVPGKPVPRISNKHNNAGGYQQQHQGEQNEEIQRNQEKRGQIQRLRDKLEHAKHSYETQPNFKKGRMQLQQQQKQQKQPRQFVPINTFQGPQTGYAFKNGNQGLGYYLDQSYQQQQKSPRSRDSSHAPLAQAGRSQINVMRPPPPQQSQTSSNLNSRPVTGSKPSKFPLSKPSVSNSSRSNRTKMNVKEPHGPHLKGPIPTSEYCITNLPLDMQHQYYTFSTPRHMRLQENLEMNPPNKYAPFMKRHKDVSNYKDRPTTRMFGSISQANKDYDSMPLRQYVSHDMMQPAERKLTKDRIERNLSSRGLSPRGPVRSVAWRNPRNMLNSAGSGQHVSVTSQQGPAWMNGPITTNKYIRATGRRC